MDAFNIRGNVIEIMINRQIFTIIMTLNNPQYNISTSAQRYKHKAIKKRWPVKETSLRIVSESQR